MRLLPVLLGLAALVLAPGWAAAVQVDVLDPLRDWRLRSLRIHGAGEVSSDDLEAVMSTRPRRWFAVWRAWPPFDPVAFGTDLDRLAALYRARGYYHARITHDLDVDWDSGFVRVTLWIDEGPPVRVVDVAVAPAEDVTEPVPVEVMRTPLPLEPGDVFSEEDYEGGRSALLVALRQRAHARAVVTKRATVDVRDDTATVAYALSPGPPCVFGAVAIEGLQRVDPDVVRREIAWTRGQEFDQRLVDETRRRLLALKLFRSVRLDPDDSASSVVRMTVAVAEGPYREVRLAAGYATDEEIRGLAAWRNYDFFGGARQLGFTARASSLVRSLAADFLQPHWPTPRSRLRLILSQEQQDEDTYTLNLIPRVVPRLEWFPTDRLSLYASYRAEFDILSDVRGAVKRALPDAAPGHTILSGAAFGLGWNGTDSLLDPKRGVATSVSVEPVGGPFGGDVGFVRVLGEGRGYLPLLLGLVAAGRLRIGTSYTVGSTTVVPLWERFYAGGVDSVRGYARRRVGPLADDHPLGGQSLLESSFELRRAVTDTIGVAAFVDGGQVDLETSRWRTSSMQWGTGGGVRLTTPIGPVRLDLGFPLDRRGDDAAWQVYVSVGQTF